MSRASVITFYSYKGGVGRTFVLANVATLLAKWGFRVLCIDFDLEAPGLRHYFKQDARPGGVVDLVLASDLRGVRWQDHVVPFELADGKGTLDLLPAGNDAAPDYGQQLARLDWAALYEQGLGHVFERWRAAWTEHYDLVFIDSRTGLTDAGGIATAQLADVLVFAFAPNRQGLEGSQRAVARARALRKPLPIERPPFLELPLPTRFDNNAVGSVRENWLQLCERELAPHYDQWRHRDAAPSALLDLLRIPYKPRWSFGEPLAVLQERPTDPDTVSYALATLAAFLARRLDGSDALVRSRDEYVRDVELRNRSVRGGQPAQYAHDVFLSYPESARDLAGGLQAELTQQAAASGRSVWLDAAALAASADWQQSLQQALHAAQHMVVLVDGKLNLWQQAEVSAFLLAEEAAAGARRCLPVWLGGTTPHGMLADRQGIDAGTLSRAELAARIWQALAGERAVVQPDPRLVPAPALDLRAAYLDAVRAAHQRVIPFFPEESERLLDDVYVELRLEPRAEPDHPRPDRLEKLPGRGPMTLRDLLHAPPAEGTESSPQSAPRWLVLGEPGAGKSTLARNLTRTLAAEGQLVVYLALGRLGDVALEPFGQAATEALGHQPERVPALVRLLREHAARGEVVFLFDGLDEVVPTQIEACAERLVAFAREFQAAPVVVLARPIAVERREIGRTFQTALVQPLDDARRRALLGKLLGDLDAERLHREIVANAPLSALCRNPLMATLAAMVARDALLGQEPLPSRRGRLYQAAIDLLLRRGHCAVPRGVKDRVAARAALRALSLMLHERSGEAWTRDELSKALWELRRNRSEIDFTIARTWGGSNDAFLDDVGHNAGVLGPHDGPGAPWRFLHRSLREFLAAEALAELAAAALAARIEAWVVEIKEYEQEATAAPSDRPDPNRWGEVYALLCGLVPEPLRVLEAVRRASAPLVLRTLPAVETLEPAVGLRFVVETESWEPEHALAACAAWRVPSGVAHAVLWDAVGSQRVASSERRCDELGRLWFTLEQLGLTPAMAEFVVAARLPTQRPSVPFVKIPAGSYLMGSPEDEAQRFENEGPRHPVSVSPFELASTPITNAQYAAFDPQFAPEPWKGVKPEPLSKHPAVNVSWWQAYLFCAWLGARLPSEAEWEYACRAGTETRYWSGDTEEDLARVGWYDGNSGGRTHAVGELPANAFGLHDVHGNVWEWCADRWHDNYEGAPADGSAWVGAGSDGVVRGGSWFILARRCRSAYRYRRPPSVRYWYVGFRPARFATE